MVALLLENRESRGVGRTQERALDMSVVVVATLEKRAKTVLGWRALERAAALMMVVVVG